MLRSVAPYMAPQDVLVGGAVGTVGAGEGLLSSVCVYVLIQKLFPSCAIRTVRAYKGSLPCVLQGMSLQLIGIRCLVGTVPTLMHLTGGAEALPVFWSADISPLILSLPLHLQMRFCYRTRKFSIKPVWTNFYDELHQLTIILVQILHGFHSLLSVMPSSYNIAMITDEANQHIFTSWSKISNMFSEGQFQIQNSEGTAPLSKIHCQEDSYGTHG